jgi:hypothetical protein
MKLLVCELKQKAINMDKKYEALIEKETKET